MVTMMNNYVVGNVLSIDGLKITIIMRQNTNTLTYFYDGITYRGVSIGEYVGIIRGPYKIVARVEKEYLNDRLKDNDDQTYSINRFERLIEVSVIGSFCSSKFDFGIKCLPMIFNEVVLLSEQEISCIIGNGLNKNRENIFIRIGNSIQENIKIEIPVNGLFNSHIGIFGNTGSGKSNTLTKLYTELFNHKYLEVTQKSKFVILDFNGEYTGNNVLCDNEQKEILKLSTRKNSGDKISLTSENFWNKETLSILFSATEKTQQPFIEKLLKYYFNNNAIFDKDTIIRAILDSFKNTFSVNQHRESLNLLKKMYNIAGIDNGTGKYGNYDLPLYFLEWNNKYGCYWKNDMAVKNKDAIDAIDELKKILEKLTIENLSIIDKLEIVVYAQLIFGLAYNHFQFEHISPLVSRIEASRSFIEKTIKIDDEICSKFLMIISLKDCNQDAKKILPLLISKQFYNEHIKDSNKEGQITKTCHLIIDEAHNILSEQTTREADSFRDYRLDVFEQIIKEGRKFGFYLTVSSQRPYDISPTIISQLHNYFIHRLVNDMDLKMLAHTVSTLDNLSKGRIPNLSPGQCILTGTLFDLPLLIQVKKLDTKLSPNSDNANILKLWEKITEDND